MVDAKKIKALIKWVKETDTQGVPMDEYFFEPLLKAFGDNQEKIIDFIRILDEDSRGIISGCAEDLYGKFMNEEMWDFLDIFERRYNYYDG